MTEKTFYDLRIQFTTFLQYVLIVPVVYSFSLQVSPIWWISAIFLSIVFAVYGFNIGIHHTFCHRTFKFPKFVEVFLMYISTIAAGTSPIGWAINHGSHHKYTDTEFDPNSPSHLKWKSLFFCFHKTEKPDFIGIRHLYKDPWQKFFNSHIGYWFTVLSWPIAVSVIFGVNGFLFLWALPLFYSLFAALIFTLSHVGKSNENGNRAMNSWFLHLVSLGDGDHEDHHTYWNHCGWLPEQCAKLIGGQRITKKQYLYPYY